MSVKDLRINEKIKAKEVLLIDEAGEKLGVIPTSEALEKADEAGLDLVEISPMGNPPVCKIIDYGKFKFEQERKIKDAKKKQQIVKLKEIRLQPKIDTHDYNFKLSHVKKFLSMGDKVKITIRFRGREMAHTEIGRAVLMRFKDDLLEDGTIDKNPVLTGRTMSMIVSPNKKK